MRDDAARFRAQSGVSRETMDRLETFMALLGRWNPKINLVAPATLEHAWTRHFLDSAQLYDLGKKDGLWVDLGSGGGFPGAVIAIMARDDAPHLACTLVEADSRKATFLRTVARETGARFDVKPARIEQLDPLQADTVSARALAPLTTLLEHAARHLRPGGRALLPKGARWQDEIAEARKHWHFQVKTHPSKTDSEAVILNIGEIERV